jgi:hypothetical protein
MYSTMQEFLIFQLVDAGNTMFLEQHQSINQSINQSIHSSPSWQFSQSINQSIDHSDLQD